MYLVLSAGHHFPRVFRVFFGVADEKCVCVCVSSIHGPVCSKRNVKEKTSCLFSHLALRRSHLVLWADRRGGAKNIELEREPLYDPVEKNVGKEQRKYQAS